MQTTFADLAAPACDNCGEPMEDECGENYDRLGRCVICRQATMQRSHTILLAEALECMCHAAADVENAWTSPGSQLAAAVNRLHDIATEARTVLAESDLMAS